MEAIASPITDTQESIQTPVLINGSQALMKALIAEGVDTIFGYPGGAIMPVYDALYDYQEQINHILVRHEQGASHAAEGYARVSGRVGVCLATSGPGATNLVTGIADALIDSTPIVCLVGQVAKRLLGTDAFQEADIMGVTMPITKWNYQITSADEVPEIISKAFYIAKSGRPGPVLIDITKSAQLELMTQPFEYECCQSLVSYRPRLTPKKEQIEAAAKLINNAKRPYIFAGHGVQIAHAEQELIAFAEKTGIPVATTLLGQSTISTDHPLYVGWLGMHGNYGANVMTDEADVIIAIGMRFDDRVTGDASRYIKQAKIVHIEIDPSEIDKIIRADAPVVGDAKEALQALLPLVYANDHTVWRNEFRKFDTIEHDTITLPALTNPEGKIRMAEVIDTLSQKTKGEAILVTDVGQHQMMASRYYQFRRPNSLVTSGGMGTMGFALPAAFGAQVGAPDRDVVAIIGDGCFQMTIQELGTIVQNKQPVKIIILNNNFLGMVRQWQQLFHERRYSFVELQNPDFITIAKGFGMDGMTCDGRENLSGALDTMLAHEGPFLLEVIVEKEENVFPMVPAGATVSQIRLS
ncbi:biosynthetic-type acetolactate synthase large subunit [Spirosoma sp. KUDC1026]|uniref:biosynthetic-type acetolactate synthase large subunit n=1 Tax=Spirosoma sp. KUDC1026 TaxID=2745947 RepID=UPI00159B8D53|nr:biosynthetic-type acetolactate synthase large subunit [Spirosoma sp. KUDC1026]QKZ11433.1 biosynthetic-type acetolactate synthase large subunit [Spirosoma sp. KUDC1026]